MLEGNDLFRAQFNDLLVDESIWVMFEKEMSYRWFVAFRAFLHNTADHHSVPEMSMSELWTLIYYAGYLSKAVLVSYGSIFDITLITKQPPRDMNADNSNVIRSGDIDGDDRSNNQSGVGGNGHDGSTEVCVPNHEIRSVFRLWLRSHIAKSITARHLTSPTIALFLVMVSGAMSSFAEEFGKLILTTMPGQFLGSKEIVYQAYVSGFLAAAAAAVHITPRWEVPVERYAGAGRLDLMVCRMNDKSAVIQEYKRIPLSMKDKKEGYVDSKRKRLTKHADDALSQVETRFYRGGLGDHVTELCEYGIAFLGPYCAVVARSLKRDRGGQWVYGKEYTSAEDEIRRRNMYTGK